MKKLLFLSFFLTLPAFLLAQPSFDFEKDVLKLDKTPEGEMISFDFPFTNTGDSPLLISEIKVTCSCTTSEFPTAPVKPGEKGIIKVSFDTGGKIGYQDRTLDIISNVPGKPKQLRFKIMVDNKSKK